MSKSFSPSTARFLLLLGAGLSLALTGCVDAPSGGYAYAGSSGPAIVDDDYIYYPDYEVYYATSRREYVYRDGSSWVRRPAPRGVSIDVLLSSPSVRTNFRDGPERHHAEIVREYPRHWTPQPSGPARPRDMDNYVYYPGQEVYYNTTQRQYVYRNGNSWVTRPEPPRGVASSPSVPVQFHDAPEHHHPEVVKNYPKNWKPAPPARKDDNRDRKDDHKDDHRDDHKDDHRDDHNDDRRK